MCVVWWGEKSSRELLKAVTLRGIGYTQVGQEQCALRKLLKKQGGTYLALNCEIEVQKGAVTLWSIGSQYDKMFGVFL